MKKDIFETVKQFEQGALNENDSTRKVVVVDSIEEFMKSHRAVHLNNLDKSLNVNGEA